MRLALVSMPWLDSHVPSAALAALAAYIRGVVPESQTEIRSAHLEVGRRLGFPLYRTIQEDTLAGEALYATLVYPEKRAGLAGFLHHPVTVAGENQSAGRGPEERPSRPWAEQADRILGVLDAHAAELAGRLAEECRVAGFTASFPQLFGNVLVCRRLKALNPDVFIVWGGSMCQGKAGPSFLREFPEIDCIVQGEGERPLATLLRALAAGAAPPAEGEAGILTRAGVEGHPAGVPTWEAADVSALPMPDFDSYGAMAYPLSVEWRLWIETSRGCWWDRSRRTGDPRRRCLFCNMNEGRSYQAKPARQVAAQVDALAARHANPRVVLNDLCMRPTGIAALGRALSGLGRELSLQMELRAGVRPREVLSLRNAGLEMAHTGIEGFSTAYLKRMHKGVTTIQNLELLKTCAELEIANPFSMVTDFPGPPAGEVAESVRNIERYATAYPPPGQVLRFALASGSAVDVCREEFGVIGVRNHPLYREFLPAKVERRLVLPYRDWAYAPAWQPEDWTPVREACRNWRQRHEQIRTEALRDGRVPPRALAYCDGRDFLEITDYRGTPRRLHLAGPWRDIYLECLEIRTMEEIESRFVRPAGAPPVREMLERFVAERVMFAEDGRYLSLACAARPDLAARRIRRSGRRGNRTGTICQED